MVWSSLDPVVRVLWMDAVSPMRIPCQGKLYPRVNQGRPSNRQLTIQRPRPNRFLRPCDHPGPVLLPRTILLPPLPYEISNQVLCLDIVDLKHGKKFRHHLHQPIKHRHRRLTKMTWYASVRLTKARREDLSPLGMDVNHPDPSTSTAFFDSIAIYRPIRQLEHTSDSGRIGHQSCAAFLQWRDAWFRRDLCARSYQGRKGVVQDWRQLLVHVHGD